MNSDCILNATQLIISQSDILIKICFVNDPSLMEGERWINRTMFILPTTLIKVGIKATNLPGSNDTSKKDDMIHLGIGTFEVDCLIIGATGFALVILIEIGF